MTKIVPAVVLCLFPLTPLSAASLCDESGCTIHLVFEAGGGIQSDHGFTLNLGADGRIVDASVVSDESAGNTSTVNAVRDYTELIFAQGGEIVIVGGNLSYPDDSRVQINGLSAARVVGGSQVSIGTVDTPPVSG